MKVEQLIDIIKQNRECVLHSQEVNCNQRCQRCYYHVYDYNLIEAYDDILTILKDIKDVTNQNSK